MNVDSILVSEFAKLDPVSNSLTVVGVFNGLETHGQPPFRFPMLSLSVVIHGHADEAGTSHEVEIALLNQRRERVNPQPINFQFTFQPNRPPPGVPLRHTHVMNLLGATFPEFGPYAFEVYIDGTYHAGTVLYISQAR